MPDNDKNTSETETILMALDQISQTIEVMTGVVGRLRCHLEKQSTTRQHQDAPGESREEKVLH